jgi:DNA-binding LacI/PurR family transcriptional regulator
MTEWKTPCDPNDQSYPYQKIPDTSFTDAKRRCINSHGIFRFTRIRQIWFASSLGNPVRGPIVSRRVPVKPTSISSLAELAKAAGVSIATVSRSLAGNPATAEATRLRVAELARAYGFQPNQIARNLRMKRTGAIGVVLPLGHEAAQHLSDPFFMSLLGPLADAVAERGYDLLLSRVIPTDDQWLDTIVDGGRVDGVIIIGQSDQVHNIERVAARYQPMVVWGATMAGHCQVTVGSDNEGGGWLAARHLLAQGRQRLAFFGNSDVPEFAARYEGFRRAVLDAGHGEPTHVPLHQTGEASYAGIQDYLGGHHQPDGIVAASDVIAMSALRVLAERGRRVPQDVGVIGYDDIVDLLFRRINGEDVESLTMQPELILRGSA